MSILFWDEEFWCKRKHGLYKKKLVAIKPNESRYYDNGFGHIVNKKVNKDKLFTKHTSRDIVVSCWSRGCPQRWEVTGSLRNSIYWTEFSVSIPRWWRDQGHFWNSHSCAIFRHNNNILSWSLWIRFQTCYEFRIRRTVIDMRRRVVVTRWGGQILVCDCYLTWNLCVGAVEQLFLIIVLIKWNTYMEV